MRRRIPWWVLALLFIVVPVAEIYVLIQIGQVIGAWWTVLLLIADGFLGSYLVKHEGSRAWVALNVAVRQGRMPAKELADGALILVGGTMLMMPGFISDIVGAFCILPFTRPLARRVMTRFAARRLVGASAGTPFTGRTTGRADRADTGSGTRTRQSPGPDGGSVVQGEVVDE